MFDSLLDSVGVSGMIVLFLVGLYFVTRIPWWLNKTCVPSVGAVETVQVEAPRWLEQAKIWIMRLPERLSVWGFFTFLIWPVMVLLNLLLLAQVLEIFLPGGERIPILGLGTYTKLSLLGGLLFSISQTVFSVTAGEVKRKSLVVIFLLLTLATIGIEMGLAGYRAATIEGIDPLATGSAGYQMVSKGVLLTMVLAFFFPVAHSVLGFVAVPRFVIPLALYLPWLILGLLYWVWSWFCRFFFGFQEMVMVPAAVSHVMDRIKDLVERVQSVEADAKRAEELNTSLSQTQKPFSEIQAEVAAIERKPAVERANWNAEMKLRSDNLQTLQSIQECDEMDREVARSAADLDVRSHALAAEARALGRRIGEMPRNAANWQQQHQELEQKLAALRDKVVREEEQCGQCQERRGELVAILKPSGAAEQVFPDARDKELADLRLAALNSTDKRERTLAMKQYALCLDLLDNRLRNQLEQVRSALGAVSRQIDKLKQASDGRQEPPPPPPVDEVSKSGRCLDQAQTEALRMSGEARRASLQFRSEISQLRRRIHSGKLADSDKAGRKQGPFGRFFAWLSGLVSEMIDAVMRANQAPEPGDRPAPATDPSLPANEAERIASPLGRHKE